MIRFAACVPILLAGLVAASPAHAATGTPGGDSAGDPYFPLQGNGGYDARSYALAVTYDPATKRLDGRSTMVATATQALSRFDLDLRRSMQVSGVTVDGVAATWSQPRELTQELVITPATPIADGSLFTVRVVYGGTVKPVIDPDGSLDGFVPTNDGGIVVSEPQGSPSWFPVNDTPDDKASYTVEATVPRGVSAISNGRLASVTGHPDSRTYRWVQPVPVSSYLVTLAIGKWRVSTGTTPGGVPYLVAVDPKQQAMLPVLAKLPAVVDYFTSVYGPYPFGQAGAIAENARYIGYSLECATRPVFTGDFDVATLAHELAHQWFGDDVTLARWRDIWLNEGFAEFSAWLWDEHSGGPSAAARLRQLLAQKASRRGLWNPPPANPGGASEVFATSVYVRGAGTLEALREKVGDPTFFTILRTWLDEHRYGNARVEDFVATAERVSHQDLAHFFDVWLYRSGKPAGW